MCDPLEAVENGYGEWMMMSNDTTREVECEFECKGGGRHCYSGPMKRPLKLK